MEANKVLREGASKMVSEGEPLLAVAAEALRAAKKRRERIERGEIMLLPGPERTRDDAGIRPARHDAGATDAGRIRCTFPVPVNINNRPLANAILKQAGLRKVF
ncbi:MAG: hypothetical protein J2P48_03060 [Alphaproteobacteria bacterium]|nr:hypothetical protein [Alphaproteobacteria bacterium]